MGDRPVIWIVAMDFNNQEKEEEFNEWYNSIHVPEVLSAPGVLAATRYTATGPTQGLTRYIAVYEFDSEETVKKAMSSKEMSSAIRDFTMRWGKYSSNLSTVVYKRIEP